MAMLLKRYIHSVVFKAVSIILLQAFFVSTLAFAFEKDTLAPPSEFWDKETVRSVRASETLGKSFRNRSAFYYISTLIGKDLHEPTSENLKEFVDDTTRAKAMIEEIRKHVGQAELAISKTRGDLDPLLYGFELDKLRYTEDKNTYTLPIYREGLEVYNYIFYIGEGSENPNDWLISAGEKNVYMKLEISHLYMNYSFAEQENYSMEIPFSNGIDNFVVGKAPQVLENHGAFICNYLVAYDPLTKTGAFAHLDFDDSEEKDYQNIIQVISNGINIMIESMQLKGATKENLQFIIIRQGNLYGTIEELSKRNRDLLESVLLELGMTAKATTTTSNFLRFYLSSGKVLGTEEIEGIKEQPVAVAAFNTKVVAKKARHKPKNNIEEIAEKLTNETIAQLKQVLIELQKPKTGRRSFLKVFGVILGALCLTPAELALRPPEIEAKIDAVKQFFDASEPFLEYWYGESSQWKAYSDFAVRTVSYIKTELENQKLPYAFKRLAFLENEIGYYERDIQWRKQTIVILEKFVAGNASENEMIQARSCLEAFAETYSIDTGTVISRATTAKGMDIRSKEFRDNLLKNTKVATDFIASISPEIQARALIVMYKKDIECYTSLINNATRPAIRAVKQLIRRIPKTTDAQTETTEIPNRGTVTPQKMTLPQTQQAHAINFAREATRNPKPAFIAVETGWIKGYEEGKYLQYDALNPLVASTRKFCIENNIPFIDGNDEEVRAFVRSIKSEDPEARGIILAGKDVIDSLGLKNDKNVILAGVDNKHLTIDSYIRLMEMLTLTMELFRVRLANQPIDEESIKSKHPDLGIQFLSSRLIIFTPHAEPMDYEDLKDIYSLQVFA